MLQASVVSRSFGQGTYKHPIKCREYCAEVPPQSGDLLSPTAQHSSETSNSPALASCMMSGCHQGLKRLSSGRCAFFRGQCCNNTLSIAFFRRQVHALAYYVGSGYCQSVSKLCAYLTGGEWLRGWLLPDYTADSCRVVFRHNFKGKAAEQHRAEELL